MVLAHLSQCFDVLYATLCMLFKSPLLFTVFCCSLAACKTRSSYMQVAAQEKLTAITNFEIENKTKVIHVFVALCDNQYQGIVPVPAAIGNGQIPATNLYWGCAYGVKAYFKKSAYWQLLKTQVLNDTIMERAIFKHKKTGALLVADAYNGKWIKPCTIDFLNSCSGENKNRFVMGADTIGILGNAQLLAYIGHDGLMDFKLSESFMNKDDKRRDAIVLACYSKNYFTGYLRNARAQPILWSTGRMAPEAYVLHDALEAYLAQESHQGIQEKAAAAYSKYQKCSKAAAAKLIVTQ